MAAGGGRLREVAPRTWSPKVARSPSPPGPPAWSGRDRAREGRAFQREPGGGLAPPATPEREGGGVQRPADPAASEPGQQPATAPPGLHGAPRRRSPPPLQGAPRSSGLLGPVAALPGRAQLGSSSAHSHPVAHLRRYRTARDDGGGGGERVTAAGGLASPAPPGSPASNARREAPPRPHSGPPPRTGAPLPAAPPRSRRVPAHCPPAPASPGAPFGPACNPVRVAAELRPIARREAMEAGRMLMTLLGTRSGKARLEIATEFSACARAGSHFPVMS